jgi:cytochrome c-type biogenesis protein CcmH/NrfF
MRRWSWAALAVVVVAAVVVLVVGSRPDDTAAARAARLEREIACPVCEGQSVSESNAPEARAIRDDIPARIAAGESDAAIRAAYVDRFGPRVLLTPSNRGIDLVAWAFPIAVLLLGACGLAAVVRRWSRIPRMTATPDDEAVVERAREERP